MALRQGHGTGAGVPRIEVLPGDEQPQPVPAPEAPPSVPLVFRQDGKIGDTATAKELGRRGGRKTAARVRLVDSLGLSAIVEQTSFGPYRSAAEEFVKHHTSELTRQAGGHLGPAPHTMVASAALQLAGSRWAFDRGAEASDPDLIKLGSQLANDSRQNLMAAYEMAVREAKARGSNLSPEERVAAMRARILGTGKKKS
jgi:hypothetical protein